jgi:tetratricopeptide (TPR) repeat protein
MDTVQSVGQIEQGGKLTYHPAMLALTRIPKQWTAHAITPNLTRCLATVLAVSFAAGVQAQESYRLTDEDTWTKTSKVDPSTPQGQLLEIRRTLALGEASRAESMAKAWIERNDRDPLLPEAYLLRGDALLAQGDEYKSLFDYEFVARSYSGSEAFVTALRRELDIAQDYAAGLHRKFLGLRILPAEDEAEEIFIRVQERMPGSRLAEEAGMALADFYFERRRMRLAAEAYALFLENYPRSSQVDKARKRLIFSQLASFKGPEFDAAGLYEARGRLQRLRTMQPAEAQRIGADALLTRIDESDAAKMLQTARWYESVGNPIAAELYVRRLVRRYPNSVAAADALRWIPTLLTQLPPTVLKSAPNYDALRAGILGIPESGASTPSSALPMESSSPEPEQ